MERKQIVWVASSKKDLLDFPEDIKRTMGYGLHQAQIGKKSENAKVLKGFGSADIIEIIDEDLSGTYRTVYAVKFKNAIVVLHAFQKKSKQGIKTPEREIDLIKNRLKQAQELYKQLLTKGDK
jgi:phage-related protein